MCDGGSGQGGGRRSAGRWSLVSAQINGGEWFGLGNTFDFGCYRGREGWFWVGRGLRRLRGCFGGDEGARSSEGFRGWLLVNVCGVSVYEYRESCDESMLAYKEETRGKLERRA
jgi:hypothetical protein